MKEMFKLGFFLAFISAIAALALSMTYTITADKIAESKAKDLNLALKTVLPQAQQFDSKLGKTIFTGRKGKGLEGFCFAVSPKGYAGPIDMIVGIDLKGKVTGVQILSMSETPGLGLNAKNETFLKQFSGKSGDDKLKAKEDIKALSGATITSNAVSLGVKEALKSFRENKELQKLLPR